MIKEVETEILDWRTLPDDIDFMTSNWSYGRDGKGLNDINDNQWSISHTVADATGNLTVTLYVLPDFISQMINRAYDKGCMEAQQSIRTALSSLKEYKS